MTRYLRIALERACRNCLRQLYFKLKWRGIGYSFQLAITAPLYSITGYCIATAQSCPTSVGTGIWSNSAKVLFQSFGRMFKRIVSPSVASDRHKTCEYFNQPDISSVPTCLRPYHVESTSSRPITEVKRRWVALVLGWVTAWEYAML